MRQFPLDHAALHPSTSDDDWFSALPQLFAAFIANLRFYWRIDVKAKTIELKLTICIVTKYNFNL